jgi:hypothetical protein
MITTANVQPGDWFVVDPRETIFDWIETGERLVERLTHGATAKNENWGHAGICTSRAADGSLTIVQAEPHGAQEVPWAWENNPHLWSSGTRFSTGSKGGYAALGYVGVGYSFLDYSAIAAHALHIPAPGLRHYIETTRHMICSQLVDRCGQDAGVQLFDDKRWNGYVTPLDLALLLEP